MRMKRVVITGRGAVSPFGIGIPALLEGLWSGRSGVRFMPEWAETPGLKSHLAAPVPSFDPKPFLPRSVRRTMGPVALYAAIAAKEAMADAGVGEAEAASGRLGAVIGATAGSPASYEEFFRLHLIEKRLDLVKAGAFFQVMGHTASANVCLALGIRGEQWSTAAACASSAQAIGLAALLIQTDRQEMVLAGGAEETHPTVTMVFDQVQAASRNNGSPETASRPFDAAREGIVCGGGGGVLLLESLESAQSRGATIYAELLGFGHVNDSRHIADPHEDSIARAMENALADAEIAPEEVDYINAHATGTLLGDAAEAAGIGRVMGGRSVPVSSLKGALGHTLAAAGALEVAALLEMMVRNEIVPTRNLKTPDQKCTGLNLPQTVERKTIKTIIKNNFALGGVNAALALRRFSG